jgi:prepilin-type N-terminal cleavage/methylation domain-containing protein
MKISSKKGFTLIELLVVIAIVSLLSSVVLASLNTARSKARDVKRLAEVRQLQTALEFYFDDNGAYPVSASGGGCGINPNSDWCNSVENVTNGHWIRDAGITEVLAPYMSAEPRDPLQGAPPANWTPLGGGAIFYWGATNWYMIVLGLENPNPALEAQDGVMDCSGSGVPNHYGIDGNGVLTVGVSC